MSKSRNTIAALLVVAATLTLEGQAPRLELSCEWWVMTNGQGEQGQAQEGMCFRTTSPARAYVVNVNGRGWEPTDKYKCRPGYWDAVSWLLCDVRFAKVYYGLDTTVQLADIDHLEAPSRIVKLRILWSETDEGFHEAPMTEPRRFNDMIDTAGEPPPAPTDTRIVR